MFPATVEELDQAVKDCKAMVTRRAAVSGTVGMVPIPGTDFLADLGMLSKLIPAINERFGLSEEQISKLSTEKKTLLYSLISSVGSSLIGRAVSKRLLLYAIKKAGTRYAAKQGIKYVPLFGTITAGVLSFGAMKYMGNSHINDCYRVAKKLLEARDGAELRPV